MNDDPRQHQPREDRALTPDQSDGDPYPFKLVPFSPEQQRHVNLMRHVAQEITAQTGNNLILKGGTGLLLAYGLPRYSTDLDFDGRRTSIDLTRPIRAGTAAASLEVEALTTKKNTDTTRRHMLHYSQQAGTPLKIEVSYRQANRIREEDITTVDGICVYRINKLATLKIDALVNRVGARDIFDASFLLHRYPDQISDTDLLAHR